MNLMAELCEANPTHESLSQSHLIVVGEPRHPMQSKATGPALAFFSESHDLEAPLPGA